MRRYSVNKILVVGIAAWLTGPRVVMAAAVDTPSLLGEMTDLKRLTSLPSPSYTTKQFSSYDRGSKTFSDHAGWFANNDRGQYLRVEERAGRKEYVMMDADGPGAGVRIWSANPEGTLRVYIDESSTPAIEADMKVLLGGSAEGFPKPIAGERARGWNLYFPLAYAKHLKMTSDKGTFYYHVNYRTYEPGTQVRSFGPDDLETLADKISDVAERLSNPRKGGGPPAERTKTPFDVTLAPGATAELWKAGGAKAICGFLVRLAAEDVSAAARNVVLTMKFDGQQTVQCPIGDFFGTAPGLIPYASLPLGITDGPEPDLWCHWWMPFGKNARITVRNLGEQEVQVHGAVAVMPYRWNENSLLFHAKWRIEREIPTRPMSDWMHLACRGNGRFVGGALHIVNPVKQWWGEGDEKIYVDGETFPSHLGTGTEDYYGYAWCSPERFVHAYHNQPKCDGPANYGNTSVNRFHIIDDIPFTRSFKFDVENWHWHQTCKTTRAAVSYWYARPGGWDFFGPIAPDDAELREVPEFQVAHVPGAIEGERMKVIAKTAQLEVQSVGERYSGEEHLWWKFGKVGDKLVLGFEADRAGRRHVIAKLTHAPDYAIIQLYVNDTKAGDPIDLFKPGGYGPLPDIDLGPFDLVKGRNTLTVEIVGANDEAIKSHMVGLDYIKLK